MADEEAETQKGGLYPGSHVNKLVERLVQKPRSLTPGLMAGSPICLMTHQGVSGTRRSGDRRLCSITLGSLASARALEEIGLSLPEREACCLRGGGGLWGGRCSRARRLGQGSLGLPRQLNIVHGYSEQSHDQCLRSGPKGQGLKPLPPSGPWASLAMPLA